MRPAPSASRAAPPMLAGAPLSALLVWLSLVLVGCLPNAVTVSLDGSGEAIRERTVLEDAGPSRAKIAQLDLTGLISDGPRPGLVASGPNPVDEFLIRLDRAASDDAVRAIVVRIDSPGGTVTASDVLHAELRRVRARTGKPIVAALGEVAASGGYYVALAADEIVAHPTSITGSIGVIIPTFNVADGLGRIGVHARAVVSGPNKNMADPFEPPTEEHYAILQGMVDEYAERFHALVRERRPDVDAARFHELTDGRVLTGAQAIEAGLADSAGSIREAFDAAKRLAGVERAELVKYVRGDARRDLSPYASASATEAGALAGAGFASVIPSHALSLDPGVAYYVWLP